MLNITVCLILLFFVVTYNVAASHIVETTYGVVEGTIEKSRNGDDFLAFYSIPFASPPVGKLRLKPPVEPEKWNGIRNCTQEPPKCIQPDGGSEDCLYLNVFVHKSALSKNGNKLPVMVFIYGGAFQTGSSNKYKGNYLMDKPIVFVTLNYRLGPLGFLGMGVNTFSGNFGLKDQAFALKWVKNNIAKFGGNPEDVTLFGQSAGAASTHLQMFNPLSKGLFHKVILQSGSAFNTWSHFDEDNGKALTTAFAVATACYRKTPEQILNCLQNLKPEDFVDAGTRLHAWGSDPIVLFKPMVEGEHVDGAALPKRPHEDNYQSIGLPVIAGVNTGETTFRILEYLKDDGKLLKDINEDYHRFLPLITMIWSICDHNNLEETVTKMKEYYFQEKDIGNDTDVQLLDMLNDILFYHPLIETMHSLHSKKYMYVYAHQVSCTSSAGYGCYKKEYGVDHSEEIPQLFFKDNLPYERMTPADRKISKQLVDFWTNFAIYGDPNGNTTEKLWTPVETQDVEYLYINTNSSEMKNNPFKERYTFLSNLPLGFKWTQTAL